MSNTAATSVLAPLTIALTAGGEPHLLVASLAIALPASTPPDAIFYSTGRLTSKDFVLTGLLAGTVGVPATVLWSR